MRRTELNTYKENMKDGVILKNWSTDIHYIDTLNQKKNTNVRKNCENVAEMFPL